MSRRGAAGLFALGVAACRAGAASTPGAAPSATSGGPGAAPSSSGGDAARIICEAECRRAARCGGGQDPACAARCGTLPVRNPAVWRTDWADAYAGCADQAACAPDDDERCLFMFMVQQPPNDAVQACLSLVSPGLRDVRTKSGRRCLVLSGLTPGATEQAAACLRSGADAHSCLPPFDWK